MSDIIWVGERAAEWAGHYGGKVAQAAPADEDKPGSAPAQQLRERMATAWASALETGDVSDLNDVLPPDEEPSA